MVIGIYAREDLKAKTDETILKQIEDCKNEAMNMINSEELSFITYEDKHYGVCRKLVGLETLKEDVEQGKIDMLITYSMSTLLSGGMDMVSFLSVLKEKGINVYYSLLCKKW